MVEARESIRSPGRTSRMPAGPRSADPYRKGRPTLLICVVAGAALVFPTACSTTPAYDEPQNNHSVSNQDPAPPLADGDEAAIVGSAPPSCPGGERVYDSRTDPKQEISNNDLNFLGGVMGDGGSFTMVPVYCSTVTDETLLSAARRSLAASPGLCPAVNALPHGWLNLMAGSSGLSDDIVRPAMKEWVLATGGGPTTEALLDDQLENHVASDKASERSVSNRYLLVYEAVRSAATMFC